MRIHKDILFAILLFLTLVSVANAQVVTTKPFPDGPQPANITASTDFTTGTSAATLTARTGKWTYLCGFVVTSAGTTAATLGKITVTGTVSATMNYTYAFVSSGQGVLGIAFPGCISSSATGTPIAVNTPAGGAGTVGSVTAWGYTN